MSPSGAADHATVLIHVEDIGSEFANLFFKIHDSSVGINPCFMHETDCFDHVQTFLLRINGVSALEY